jgi:hypothetical protein
VRTKSLEPNTLRTEIKITLVEDSQVHPNHRPVEQVSLGPIPVGAALPHVDHSDPETTLIGQNRRVCFQNSKPNRATLRRFRKFVKQWIATNMIPLSPDTDTSIETWLSKTHYPQWRKQQLLDNWNFYSGHVERRHYIVNGFVKDETYPQYKNSRGINARTDMFKVAVGPIFKCIEQVLFKNSWFIKYVPVPDRAKLIYDTLYDENVNYYATDHTSFEGHFTKEFMKACEFELYDFMTSKLPAGVKLEFMKYINEVLGGTNEVFFKHFAYKILATRMTGEMCTSLGNGFSNLMMILFVTAESGFETRGFVEGDDSIFTGPRNARLKDELFKELGFTIKLEKLDDIHTASFCGNVFCPGDYLNVTNPIEILLSFGWTTNRYARSKNSKHLKLLRSKALSLLYEYRGAPIIKNLALYALRMTEGYRACPGQMNEYQREQLELQMKDLKTRGLPIIDIPNGTRLLVEDLYKIPIEIQFALEEMFDGLTEIQELDLTLIEHLFHPEQVDYYQRYVHDIYTYTDLDRPNIEPSSPYIWGLEYISKVNLNRTTLY